MKSDLSGVTVAFDWNGTLVRDRQFGLEATNRVLEVHGCRTLIEQQFRRRFCLPLHRFLSELGIPARRLREAEHQWNIEMQRLGEPPLTRGAANVVRVLGESGARLGVVSAAAASTVGAGLRRIEAQAGVTFDFVTCSVSEKAPAISRLVNESTGPVFYVGDTDFDVEAARTAGARAIGFSDGYQYRSALVAARPDDLINEMQDLLLVVCRRSV